MNVAPRTVTSALPLHAPPATHARPAEAIDRTLRRATRYIVRYRTALVVSIQLLLIAGSNYAAYCLRFDGAIPRDEWARFVRDIGLIVALRGAAFIPFHLYEGLWRYVGAGELVDIAAAVGSSSVVAAVLRESGLAFEGCSRSVFVIDPLLLVAALTAIRLPNRLFRQRTRRRGTGKRVLIFGAGDAGEMIVRDMLGREHGYDPIGFIDDSPAKVGQHIHGVPVLGSRNDLARIMRAMHPDEALVAIPSAGPSTIQEVVKLLQPFHVPITTLPSVCDILDGRVAVHEIRDLTIEDLLPRAPVDLNVERLGRLIAGRAVVVTGAGGSIGAELSRQIAAFGPASLVLYERYENTLHDLTHDLSRRCSTECVHPVIGDVTDARRVHQVFETYRPAIVFHAAAHKHVPLMEHNPCEAVKNNVIGTATVAEAADGCGAERFILISTDKAVNPSSVMGATKYVAEAIVRSHAAKSATRFVIVRFGNVLGSNGSVLPRFLEQVRAGGPVTVTHPDIRRYFMLIPEAVQLVLHAAALGEPAATYVLDMGEQIKLVDLARNVIRLAGFLPDVDIPVTFIGLRPGEKLFEELVGDRETAVPSPVPKILRVRLRDESTARGVDFDRRVASLVGVAAAGDAAATLRELRSIVPTFAPGFASARRVEVAMAVPPLSDPLGSDAAI